MKKLLLILLFPVPVLAEVNMKDASYYKTWSDFQGSALSLNRTYRSRSLYKGAFGFGWCATFEKSVDISTESPQLVECGVPLSTPTTLKKENDTYIRIVDKNSFEKYNSRGLLIQISSPRAAFSVQYNQNDRPESLTSPSGDRLTFGYQGARIREVMSSSGEHFSYTYEGEDLVSVKSHSEVIEQYKYDLLHNLEHVDYSDQSFEAMTYDTDRDWILSTKTRDNCSETFNYRETPEQERRHYISTVEKRCSQKIVYSARYEFWHKTRADGSTYLSRSKVSFDQNETDITYHPVSGLPTQISQNGRRIQ